MAVKISVYISSTPRDLEDYRKSITQVVLRFGLYPIVMETFSATSKNPLQLCYDKVQEADIFVGLYAHRYGYAPPEDLSIQMEDGEIITGDNTTSIIEWEYQWALERNIPMLLFMVDDDVHWPGSMIEDRPGLDKLRAFKRMLLSRHVVGFFTSPDNLALQVASSLSSIISSDATTSRKASSETSGADCIENFDNRVLNSVMKAIELTNTFREASKSQRDVDNPHLLCVEPSFSTPPSKLLQYQCDVFVIMPFADQFSAVYSDIIKPVCTDLQLSVKRGDDFSANEYIIEEIWHALNNCRLIIADCTGGNANVFYELGIAHTLGKSTILITQSRDDVPFDIAARRILLYEDSLAGSRRLSDELNKRILIALNDQNGETDK